MPPRKPHSSTSARKLSRPEQHAAAWKRWEAAASRWKGLDDHLRAKSYFRHISRTESGYQVRIMRGGKRIFDRTILGHSEESLLEALRSRDEALQKWPGLQPRKNVIPAQVLKALGLTEPVIGIHRCPGRSVFRANYQDPPGRRRVRQFYFRVVPEEVAYAAAIAFLETTLKS